MVRHEGTNVKVRDLIKNAIVLHSGGKAEPEKGLPALLKSIEFKNISSLAAYLLAQMDNEADPIVRRIREAGELEASGRPALLRSIEGMSSFNKVLNVRYGVANSILLNVDDPALADVIASLPHGILKYQPLQRPAAPQLRSLFSREIAFGSYLASMATFLKDHHNFNKAVSETLAEQNRGHRHGVFSKMTFLRSESLDTLPHATLIRPKEGLSVSLLRFDSSDDSTANASRWHGKDLIKTYLFFHELGHCVMEDETHQMFFERFIETKDDVAREWMGEVYADVYAALHVARMSKNWDFLPLCILPERVNETPDHNTFHCLRKLPHLIKAQDLQRLDDREVAKVAHNLMEQFIASESEPRILDIQNCASRLYQWSAEHHASRDATWEDELKRLAGVAIDPEFRLAVIHAHAQRMQAIIDSLGIKMQLGIPAPVAEREIHKIAGMLRLAGHDAASNDLSDLARMARIRNDLNDKYQAFMSPSAIEAGERYEQTMIHIQDFWSEWENEESRYRVKAKSPAFEGQALG